MADTAERWFGRPVEVLAVDQLSPGLRLVGFGGAQLRGRGSTRGQEIEFRVEDRHFRHCTPSRFDSIHGRFDVVLHDPGDGPGVRVGCDRWSGAGAIEVPAADADGSGDLVPGMTVLPSLPTLGDALRRWLADGGSVPRVGATGTVVLAGHAQTIQDIRARLRDLGAARSTICTEAYWATGRTGL